MKKHLLTGALVLGSVWMLAGCGSTEVDLSQFVEVEFEGVDGKGSVLSYKMNEDELDDALSDANEDMSKRERQKLIDSIELELEKNSSKLSNGDKVKVGIEWSERKAEKYDIVFTGDEKEVKVSGLKELEEIDAFKDIEIKYSGVSPFVQVSVKNNSKNEFLKECYYSVEYESDEYYTGVGKEFEITVSYSESDAEELGYKVKEDNKTIKLKEGDVDAYVTDPAAVSGDALTEMTQAGQSVLNEKYGTNAYTYRDMMSDVTGAEYNWDFDLATAVRSDYKLDKIALLVAKDEDHGKYQYNMSYFVFENTVQDSVNVNPVTVYYVVKFEDVVQCADGTIDVNLEDASFVGFGKSMEDIGTLIENKASRTYDVTELEMQ